MAHVVYLTFRKRTVPETIKLTKPKDRGIQVALADLGQKSTKFTITDKNHWALAYNPEKITLKGGGEPRYLVLNNKVKKGAEIRFEYTKKRGKVHIMGHTDLHVEC